jgi:hypothetical protein
MFGFSPKELIIITVIIIVLSYSGLWPVVIRGLRELRGERVDDPAPAVRSGDMDMCFRLMGLSPTATMEEVERAYRQKAKKHHPDHGGDDDTMRALNEAYQRIRKVRGR